jgi:hypothetical protein
MRTKTLLIAAAVLAVGVASSLAQTTYSQNVVGYVNTTIGANGYAIVGNQLVNGSDANATNNDINAVLGAGLVSQPIDPPESHNNTVLYYYNGGYFTYYYFNAADAAAWGATSAGPGFFDESTGDKLVASLTQGKAVFLFNHSGSAITATITGNVLQGTNALASIQSGYQLVSIPQPISTNAAVANYGLPALTSQPVDPPDSHNNDVMYLYNGGYFTYYYFNAADAAAWGATSAGPGFFDESTGDIAPQPAVNQGFFLLHHGSAVAWPNVFTVQ